MSVEKTAPGHAHGEVGGGGGHCPRHCKVEDHEHIFRHCFLGAFIFDTVRRAFGVLRTATGAAEPSRVLHEQLQWSLTTPLDGG